MAATGAACACAALVAVVAGALSAQPRAGLAFAAGVLIGASNAFLARRLLSTMLPFAFTSMARLAALSVTGSGIGILLGVDVAWLTIGGLAVAQLVLSVASAREVLAR
jgi:hypothetical protein